MVVTVASGGYLEEAPAWRASSRPAFFRLVQAQLTRLAKTNVPPLGKRVVRSSGVRPNCSARVRAATGEATGPGSAAAASFRTGSINDS